jgi:hypothetical protein
MNENLRQQIYHNMDLKETDELLDIWQTNDRTEWTDLTFKVIEEILKKRKMDIPPQDEPVLESDENEDEPEHEPKDNLEDWEAKLLDKEDQPDFYDVLEVLSLKDNINKAAKAVIWVNVAVAVAFFPTFQKMISGFLMPYDLEMAGLLYVFANVIAVFLTVLSFGLNIVITYFPLKALAHILRILMEMEFNSRKTSE